MRVLSIYVGILTDPRRFLSGYIKSIPRPLEDYSFLAPSKEQQQQTDSIVTFVGKTAWTQHYQGKTGTTDSAEPFL